LDIDKNKTPIRYVSGLRDDVIGLPLSLAWHLANRLYAISPIALIPPLEQDPQTQSQVRALQRLREFVQATRFRFPRNDISDCRAFLTSDEHIELSELYRTEVDDTPLKIVPVSSQQTIADRWYYLKLKINSLDLVGVLTELLRSLEGRDMDIICGFYGLLGEEKTSAAQLAETYGLSRARVYQIVKRSESDTRLQLDRYRPKISHPLEQHKNNLDHILHLCRRKTDGRPEAVLSRWVQEIGESCFDLQISIATVLDYVEALCPSEFSFLQKVFPPVRSPSEFCAYLQAAGEKYSVPDVVDPEATLASYFTKTQRNEIRNLRVADLPFPEPIIASLQAAGFHECRQLLSVSALDLYQTPNITRETFAHLLKWSGRLVEIPEEKHPKAHAKPTVIRKAP
jgi:hypothetical protein